MHRKDGDVSPNVMFSLQGQVDVFKSSRMEIDGEGRLSFFAWEEKHHRNLLEESH